VFECVCCVCCVCCVWYAKGGKELTLAGLEVDSKDRRVKAALDVVKPRLLLSGRDSVEGAERQTKEAIEVALGGEGARDSLRGLDGLLRNGQAADLDDVGIHNTAGRAAVAVADGPSGVGELGRRAALAGAVQGLAVHVARAGVGAEDPQVRGARVEVQVQRLRGRADLHGRQPLRVVLLRVRHHGPRAALAVLRHPQRGSQLRGNGTAVLEVRLGDLGRAMAAELGVACLVHGEAAGLRYTRGRECRGGA